MHSVTFFVFKVEIWLFCEAREISQFNFDWIWSSIDFFGIFCRQFEEKSFFATPFMKFWVFFPFCRFQRREMQVDLKIPRKGNIPILIFHISLMLYYFRGWFLFIFDSFSITLFYCVEFIMRMFFLFLMKSINWSKMYLTIGRLWVQRKTRLK